MNLLEGKGGKLPQKQRKTPREIELRAQLTRLKGMGGRARRTSRPDEGKRHMPWLKPVEPRPLRYRWSPGRPRVRGAADSSITTVTANRSHSLPTQSQEIAGRHKHQQKEKKKKVENGDEPAGQEPTAHSQLPSPWSHRDLYQSVATTSMDGWRCANWRCGLEAIQEKAPQNSFVWGAESRRSTPCEATDKCMWSPSSPNFRKARAAGGMEKQVSFHANQSVHGSMPPEDPG